MACVTKGREERNRACVKASGALNSPHTLRFSSSLPVSWDYYIDWFHTKFRIQSLETLYFFRVSFL